MKVYIDVVMMVNFFFDFILLLSVAIILRRRVSIFKIMLGSFIGGISILFLFINMNSLVLFIFKILISIIMILTTFGYKSIRYTFKNFVFLYSASIILGGFLYYLNTEFSYLNKGLVFVNKGMSINFIFLIISSPIIIYIYVKQGLWLKNNYSNYYNIILFYNNEEIKLTGFLDTGNNLSTITNKPITLIDKEIICEKFFYVTTKSVGGIKQIKCFKAGLLIDKKYYKNAVVGLLEEKIKIDGIDCILNKNLLEGI